MDLYLRFPDRQRNERDREKLSGVSENGFTAPGNSKGESSVRTGDVFVFPPSEKFPGGYAMKVTGYTPIDNGQTYNYTAKPASTTTATHIVQTATDP